ncbi:hypothetical protein IT575_05175 [bacterium]|nr:hypothetical protein [bacterium]
MVMEAYGEVWDRSAYEGGTPQAQDRNHHGGSGGGGGKMPRLFTSAMAGLKAEPWWEELWGGITNFWNSLDSPWAKMAFIAGVVVGTAIGVATGWGWIAALAFGGLIGLGFQVAGALGDTLSGGAGSAYLSDALGPTGLAILNATYWTAVAVTTIAGILSGALIRGPWQLIEGRAPAPGTSLPFGRIARVTPDGIKNTYFYDWRGRLVWRTDWNSGGKGFGPGHGSRMIRPGFPGKGNKVPPSSVPPWYRLKPRPPKGPK